jgi:DNA-binding transcriptional MerR regulator
MRKEHLISTIEFCTIHDIEISFISSLHETGLIEIITIEETEYFDKSQLQQLEKIIRLYYDLGINLEGIETITHLLNRLNDMRGEITSLKNRLRLYESND